MHAWRTEQSENIESDRRALTTDVDHFELCRETVGDFNCLFANTSYERHRKRAVPLISDGFYLFTRLATLATRHRRKKTTIRPNEHEINEASQVCAWERKRPNSRARAPYLQGHAHATGGSLSPIINITTYSPVVTRTVALWQVDGPKWHPILFFLSLPTPLSHSPSLRAVHIDLSNSKLPCTSIADRCS
jgi:hypothetical protein